MITEFEILRHIRSRLGANVRSLELNDEQLMEIITEEVLPEISVYYPYQIYHDLHVRNDRTRDPAEYWLKLKEDYTVIAVNKIFLDYSDHDVSHPKYTYGGVPDLRTVAFDQMNAHMNSYSELPVITRFIPPNKMRVNPIIENMTGQNIVTVRLDVVHKTLQTLKPGLRDIVKDYALGCVCENILGFRRFFTNLNTTFGELNVNTDILERFVEKKEEAKQKMEENFVTDYPQKVWVY